VPIGEGSIKLTLRSQGPNRLGWQREGVPGCECCLFPLRPMGSVGRIRRRSASWLVPMADAEERETDASRGITTAVDGPKIVLGVGRGYIVGRRVA
jgi:hypothetical protein